MKQRMTAAVRLATIFVVIIMAISVMITLSSDRAARFVEEEAWSTAIGNVQSLQVIDLDADGSDDLFIQTTDAFSVYNAQGEPMWAEALTPPISTTMGDVNGDGAEDLVSFQSNGRVQATSGGAALWTTSVQRIGEPARAAVTRFRAGTQVVLGDANGRLVGLSGATGAEQWRGAMDGTDAVRGLDDALVGGSRFLVVANRAGELKMFAADGSEVWQTELGALRRMRTFDVDGDGNSEIYGGGEAGVVYARGTDGAGLWSERIGQQVIEIRDGELDGNPSSREIVVGGRDGGVFAFDSRGGSLWSPSVGSRVADIATVDLDGDGTDETVVGDEAGGLTIFAGGSGERFRVASRSGAVTGIDEGRLTAPGQVIVSAGREVSVLTLTRQNAPFFYSPLIAGIVLSLAIASAAFFVGGLPEPVPTRVVVTDSSPEGVLARRRMLHENIADVERLRAEGEIDGGAALAKLESLRSQLAETDQAVRAGGIGVAVETTKCPNCGGRVPLGHDQCDYCGEVVIA